MQYFSDQVSITNDKVYDRNKLQSNYTECNNEFVYSVQS